MLCLVSVLFWFARIEYVSDRVVVIYLRLVDMRWSTFGSLESLYSEANHLILVHVCFWKLAFLFSFLLLIYHS